MLSSKSDSPSPSTTSPLDASGFEFPASLLAAADRAGGAVGKRNSSLACSAEAARAAASSSSSSPTTGPIASRESLFNTTGIASCGDTQRGIDEFDVDCVCFDF